ncbi:hypothetical protein VTN49DRAFT_5853 [Thermomyces lanuginosus]|uniref:uncharacterized protein n=1 Tax=Thermomyces lanuginosus TaxID=5541 RepID=UPI0037441F32
MGNWRDDYYAALGVRDEREQANKSLYDTYTRLADRTAAARALTPGTITPAPPQSSPSQSQSSQSRRGASTPQADTGQSLSDAVKTARDELAAAQRSRSELQERLNRATAELEKLKAQAQRDQRRIATLESERAHLQLRLKDRDEELREKAKLLDNVQDELAALNLQLNMAEERSNRLQKENQELIDRWMARVGQEADAMNEASKF